MEKLILHNINKSYERCVPVLKDISFSVAKGEFVVLLGPSGSGKSTILSIIAGFEQQTSGDIIIDGINCNQVPCQKREIAMVFQNYALYPSMNVYNNIAFPLVNKHEKRTVINQKVSEISKVLHIEDILRKKVNKISGGQKQRVAIGRALIRNPALLLLDEPLSNLDAVLRTQMRKELYNLHSQLKTTMVYVTHDQAEALSLATKIIVLNNGEIQQIGTPREIYDSPKNVFVATFIGTPQMNIFKECNTSALNGSNFSVSLLENTFYINPNNLIELPVSVDIGIRSEDMELIENDRGTILNDLFTESDKNKYLNRLNDHSLLIIDDLGIERGTEYALEQVYNVIDTRYKSGKPLIITTNLTLDELKYPTDIPHKRIYDRVLGMCVPVMFNGMNFRKEEAAAKMEAAKKLFGMEDKK